MIIVISSQGCSSLRTSAATILWILHVHDKARLLQLAMKIPIYKFIVELKCIKVLYFIHEIHGCSPGLAQYSMLEAVIGRCGSEHGMDNSEKGMYLFI